MPPPPPLLPPPLLLLLLLLPPLPRLAAAGPTPPTPEESLLTPEVGAAPGDGTGSAVAVSASGRRLLVGAPGRNEALIFNREFCELGPCWAPAGALTGDAWGGINFDANLGGALALSPDGTAAVVGASGDGEAGEQAGSAFVFREVGGIWRPMAKLLADDAASNDFFGNAVALSPDGTVAVVGARSRDERRGSSIFTDCGAAYVFVAEGGNWQRPRQLKLLASDALAGGDQFGYAVAVASSGTIVVGTPAHNSGGGAVYVYRRVGGPAHWEPVTKLAVVSESLAGARSEANRPGFGNALSFSVDPADTLLIGAYTESGSSVTVNAGSAYVYRRQVQPDGNETWVFGKMLTAGSVARGFDFFGSSLALSADGTAAIVGSPGTDAPILVDGEPGIVPNAGRSYLFRLVNTSLCPLALRRRLYAASAEDLGGDCQNDDEFRDMYGLGCEIWEVSFRLRLRPFVAAARLQR